MGCDIHLHTEVKINGVWHHYGSPHIDRNYTLFGKMAGVRNTEVEPIAPPRGVPEDATELTKFDCEWDGGDGHSHSWLNAEEIAILNNWWHELFGYGYPEGCPELQWGYLFQDAWGGFKKGNPEGLEDIRFIFWFDN